MKNKPLYLKIQDIKEYAAQEFLNIDGSVLITDAPEDFGSALLSLLEKAGAARVTVPSNSVYPLGANILATSVRVYSSIKKEAGIVLALQNNTKFTPNVLWRLPEKGRLRCLELWWT